MANLLPQLPSQVGQPSQLTAHSTLGSQSSAASANSHWPLQPPESIILALEKWQTSTIAAYKTQVKLVAHKKAQFTKLATHKANGTFTACLQMKFAPFVNIPKSVSAAACDEIRQAEASKFLAFKNSVLDGRIELCERDWQDSKVILANLLSDRWLKEQLLLTSPSMSQFMFAFTNYLVSYKVAVEAYNAEMTARAASDAANSRRDDADIHMSADTPAETSHAALRADINKLTAQVQALTMKLSSTAPSKAKPKNGSGPGRGTTNPPRANPGQTKSDKPRSASRPPPRSSPSRPKRQSSPSEDDAADARPKKRQSRSPHRHADPGAGRGRSRVPKSDKRAPSGQRPSASRA